jgi:hypothetical protein
VQLVTNSPAQFERGEARLVWILEALNGSDQLRSSARELARDLSRSLTQSFEPGGHVRLAAPQLPLQSETSGLSTEADP